MRIEKLEFRNLNSLVGHYTIDFTHPSLADAGMFIISGPTGAGKTTILDAVSYALYGSTPRLSQEGISAKNNELMSKDAADCMASVVFEVKGKRYRVTTEHKRANARTKTGKDFAAPKRTLARVEDDGQTTTMETLVRGVDARVETITGLSFENFKRCMMLAQGEFATFLKAKDADRAAVLSTITGTDIYGAIGKKVCDKCSELKQKVEELQLVPVMNDEELAEHKRQLAEQSAGVERLRGGIKEHEDKMKWLDDLHEIAERCSAATAEATAAQKELADFQAGETAQKMQQGKAAQAVKPAYDKWEEALRERNSARRKREATHERVAASTERVAAAQKEAESALAECDREIPRLTEQKKRVQEQLIPLEKEQKAAEAKVTAGREELQRAEEKHAAAQQAAAQAEEKRAQGARAQQEHEAAQKAQLHDAALPGRIALIESRYKDLRAAAGDRTELLAPAEVEKKQALLVASQEAILKGRSREDLVAKLSALQAVQQAQQAHAEAVAKEQAAQAEYDRELAALRALPSVQEAIEAEKQAQQNVDRLHAVCSIQEQLADLYEKFAAGEYEHCPCCGASAPGAKPAHVEESMLKSARDKLAACSGELLRRREQQASAQSKVDLTRGALSAAQQHARECETGLGALVAKLNASLTEGEAAALIASVKDELEALDALATKLRALENDRTLAERADDFLQEVRPFSPETPATLLAAETLTAQLRTRADSYTAIATALENDKTAMTLNAELCKKAAEAESAAAADLSRARDALHKTEQEKAALAEKRAQLWAADEDAVTALNRLSDREQSLLAAHRKADDALKTETAELEKQKALEVQTRSDWQAAETTLADALTRRDAAMREHAFATDEAYRAVCAYIPHVQEWETRLRSLKDNELRTKTQADTLNSERDKLASRKLTTDSRESLQAACVAMKEQLPAAEAELQRLHSALDRDTEKRTENRDREALRQELTHEQQRWETLRAVIHASRSGDGFKRYAQQITFGYLIAAANEQLLRLNDRYELRASSGDNFNLLVIDRWSDDEKGRDCSNLSGGESFIVSLALALGLSGLSGGETSIDTLFLDEGFGTLDPDTLERVLSSLEQLRASGKLIGIISHVDKLKERMPASARLEITRTSSSSTRSTLAAHPAVNVHVVG